MKKAAICTITRCISKMANESNTFDYFAYGSNLLKKRIHIRNPSAVFKLIARLDGYRLEFDYNPLDSRWHGAAATITESKGDHVWGVLWTLNKTDMESLDVQEGVGDRVYEPRTVDVTDVNGKVLRNCRTYYLVDRGFEDRRPSPQYLDVIIRGAIEHDLPVDYVKKLKAIEHNGYDGPLPLADQCK